MKKLIIVLALLAGLTVLGPGAQAQIVQEWAARYNGPYNGGESANDIAVDSSGNVYVTGGRSGESSVDFFTMKYDSAGIIQWVIPYNGPGNGVDSARCIELDAAGNVYVTGLSTGAGTGLDYATIKYNSAGIQQWVARYNGPIFGNDQPYDLAVDAGGNVYVTGQSQGSGTGYDYLTVKYNAAGVQQWEVRYNGPGNYNDVAWDLALDQNGCVYVTGWSRGANTHDDYATIKYDSSGVRQWVARYNGAGNYVDAARSVAVDPDGNVYVTGESCPSLYAYNYLTIKYNSAGVEQWTASYNNGGIDQAFCLALDADRNVYVTGRSQGSNYDYATVKYNSAGQQLWVARYYGSGNGTDWPNTLVLDDSANVYVTGWSAGLGTGDDYATIKYSTDGVQQWGMRYDGPVHGTDQANSLALDQSHNVYVTGGSTGSGTGMDYATIKYVQAAPPPALEVTLTPLNPPLQVPAAGGSFQFNTAVQRVQAPQIPFTVWARDKYPDGSYTATLLGPVSINPPVGQQVTRLRTQNVPGTWPAGIHWYIGYANPTVAYPAVDADSFSWTKLTTEANNPWVSEATCTGELFPGEAEPLITHNSSLITSSNPNPFNPTTAIGYQLSALSQVSLRVYDSAGRLVATLVAGMQEPGPHSVTFDGTRLASGIYLYRLQAGPNTATGKMVLLK